MSTARGNGVILSSPPPPIFGPPQFVVAPGPSQTKVRGILGRLTGLTNAQLI
jgi:hypothetical protein